MAFRPSYRPAVGDWKNEVRRRAGGLVTSWGQAVEQAETELQAEGRRFALVPDVEQRAREILARTTTPKEPSDG